VYTVDKLVLEGLVDEPEKIVLHPPNPVLLLLQEPG